MGQHSSKRRSYTPGQDVQSEIPTDSLVNGDVKYDVTSNGDIEGPNNHQHDVQMRTSTKSHAPVTRQSSSTSGKKDKSKKIRIIGISLRRTPSGRWTRKRRSMRANGSARPASCPVTDLKPTDKGAQLRPQSLFEEEVITEEDGKIETVDLSDNEDTDQAKSGQASATGAAAGPVAKPRDKKWRRGSSDKKQGSKKRKKEKKSTKRDKTKRPTSPKTTKAPAVPLTPTSSDAEKMSAEDEDAKPEELHITSEESQQQNNAPDIDDVASSIVQDSINIARDKYMSEQNTAEDDDEDFSNRNENSKSEETTHVTTAVAADGTETSLTPVDDVIEAPQSVSENESTPGISTDDRSPLELEESIMGSEMSLVDEMAPMLFRDGEVETVEEVGNKVHDDAPEERTQEPIEVKVEVVKSENEEDAEKKTESLSEVVPPAHSVEVNSANEVVEDAFVQEHVDKVKTIPTLSISPPDDDDTDDIKDNENDNDKTENNEQTDPETNENNMESESAECVQNEVVEKAQETSNNTKEEDGTSKHNDETLKDSEEKENEHKTDDATVLSDTEVDKKQKNKHTKEQREKEKAEKDRLKKQKDEEKAKEKERKKEEKRKKAEQKSAEKVKLREKGERKSTISKRFSDWFKHDKSKTPESSQPNAEEEGAAGTSGANDESNIENSTQLESVNNESTSSQPNTSSHIPDSSSASESLAVDVSVQPLSDLSSSQDPDQPPSPQPSPSDIASPDSTPVSPTLSNDIPYSDPPTPTSDRSESSGGLKKILLGPRLRTAILRKKSSGASDCGAEDKRVSLTQPKGVETSDVTAPPRKLRPRKPVEQYSPVTVGAHNPIKHTSPHLEHKDNDTLPVELELHSSCHESLPENEDITVDDAMTSSVVEEVSNSVTVVEVKHSSQSISGDHSSLENEPITACSNSTVENVEDSLQTSSPELQSESTSVHVVSEEVIEQSHTQNASLKALPSIDSAAPSAEVSEHIVESVSKEVKSEIIQKECVEEESPVAQKENIEEESSGNENEHIEEVSEKDENEKIEENSSSKQDENVGDDTPKNENEPIEEESLIDNKNEDNEEDSQVANGNNSIGEDTLSDQNESSDVDSSINEDCVDSKDKYENESEKVFYGSPLPSPTVVSTARIVLRSMSNESSERVHVASEGESLAETKEESEPVTSISNPVQPEAAEDETTSPLLSDEDVKESKEENEAVSDDKPETKQEIEGDSVSKDVPEKSASVSEKLDEVEQAVSDVLAKTSDEKKQELDDEDVEEEEEEECQSSQYTVVCRAMSVDEQEEEKEKEKDGEESTPGDVGKQPEVDVSKDDVDSKEEEKSEEEKEKSLPLHVETGTTIPHHDDNDDIIQQEETSSDSGSLDNNHDHNAAAASSTSSSSSSSDHWEGPPKLDIHLDDSAIEMDKESPLADTQSPVSIDCSSSIGSVKPEDEGVNSDNSSDNNDNVEKNDDESNTKTDSNSTDTIEAYLKLQQHIDVVKDVSPKNHIVDDCGLLEPEDFRNHSENGVADHSSHSKQEEQTPQETSASS